MKHESYVLRNIKDMHFEVCNVCNLSCMYCCAYQPASGKRPFMPLETAQKYIALVFKRTCAQVVDLMFYGGEALLHDVSWFHDVIEYANKQAIEHNKEVRFLMQSNATSLDAEKLDLIRKHNIVTGTSLDGPPDINEKTRGKTNLVMENILRLKEARAFGGVICIVNENNYHKVAEILEFFEEQQIFWVAVNIVYSIGRGRNLVPLNAHKVFSAYEGIYNYLENTKGKKVVEGNMAEKLNRYIHPPSLTDFKQKLICNYPFCGGGITAILCDSEGDLYPCGCANATTQFLLGNVNSLDEQAFMDRIHRFHEKSNKYNEECRLCDAARICNFGCPGFKAIDNLTDESECRATKMFYAFLKKRDQQVIQEIVQNLRTGKQEHDWRSKSPEV